jgi:hypothetical protein
LQRNVLIILVAAIALLVVSIVIYFSYDYILGLTNPRPDLRISAAPSTVTLSYKGSHNSTIITVESQNGLAGDIDLSVEIGLGIIGVDHKISPSVAYLSANAQITIVLEFDVKSSVPPGRYFADVTVVVGNITRVTQITIEVSY